MKEYLWNKSREKVPVSFPIISSTEYKQLTNNSPKLYFIASVNSLFYITKRFTEVLYLKP
jgi:hypothetical protein